MNGVRLRQVALVTADLAATCGALQSAFGLGHPFHDPTVGEFGLANAVFAVGDTFLEVVSPTRPGTAGGRHLERQGGDSGYMAVFQVPDLAAAQQRLGDLGVRRIWEWPLEDSFGMHLHPKDVPGAIVSLDWVDPPESWHWAGPAWTGGAPRTIAGGLTGCTVRVDDPGATARRWAAVLDLGAHPVGTGAEVRLPGGEVVTFLPSAPGERTGITDVGLALPGAGVAEVIVAGVRFVISSAGPSA